MFNRRTLAVIKRELRENLLSKSFILMTLLIPVFMFGIIGIQTFMISMSGDEKANIKIVSGNTEVADRIKQELSDVDHVKSGFYQVDYLTMNKDDFNNYLKENKQQLIDGKITGIVYVPGDALKNKNLEYYSKNPNNNSLFQTLRYPINRALVGIYFNSRKLSSDDIKYASEGVDFKGYRISKEEKIEQEGYGNMIASFLFTFLLYFSLIMMGTIVMRSVVHEKTTRIVEVLLSSLNARELMTGKILGIAIMATAQMTIWLTPIILLISTTWFMIPPEFTPRLELMQIVYFLFNYFIGLLTFLGLYAAGGAIFDNDQDAQSVVWPIMLLIMIPFFIAISMQNNPDSTVVKIASMLPFAAIIVMPARGMLVDVPFLQYALSIVINIVTMVLIIMLAGKIYRVGILMTGKKPKWGDVAKWLKFKY